MNVIDLYHLECRVIKLLRELSLEQIIEIQRAFERMYPNEIPLYIDLFNLAIYRKRKELRMNEIISMVEELKNTTSDDVAAR